MRARCSCVLPGQLLSARGKGASRLLSSTFERREAWQLAGLRAHVSLARAQGLQAQLSQRVRIAGPRCLLCRFQGFQCISPELHEGRPSVRLKWCGEAGLLPGSASFGLSPFACCMCLQGKQRSGAVGRTAHCFGVCVQLVPRCHVGIVAFASCTLKLRT